MITKILLFVLTLTLAVPGAIRRVPADYTKIQSAIDASVDGDTVLVSPGTYFENINFRGKGIKVGSLFITTNDYSYINTTIINGSNPTHADTASCVLFINGEDSTSVIAGFTLTGGTGTKWLDEHGAGTYYEGGGILAALSSPIIRNNIIINNEAIRRLPGSSGAGGGGIRCGDASPQIYNNIIMQNRGMYGAGIVLNYCIAAVVKNNIIMQNSVYQAVTGVNTFGGGGIWINSQLQSTTNKIIIENNTIVGNSAFGPGPAAYAGRGGGLFSIEANIVVTNNMIWNNIQAKGNDLTFTSGSALISYNNIAGTYTGVGNMSINPLFSDSSFYLSSSSPMIDAGSPDPLYNDPFDPSNPTMAKFPSMGLLRNDIGAYGGPRRMDVPSFSSGGIWILTTTTDFDTIQPGTVKSLPVHYLSTGDASGSIDSARFKYNNGNKLSVSGAFPRVLGAGDKDSLIINWSPSSGGSLLDTLFLFIQGKVQPSPVIIKGISSVTGVGDKMSRYTFSLLQNYPNPFNPKTTIRFSLVEREKVSLKIYNILGNLESVIIDDILESGYHQYEFKGTGLASGVYFYELTTGNKKQVKKLTLLK